ncbi:MAG: glycosyltransferase [Dehalococcoidales bacterium]|nr:glycosyltransferase [Dehalococcoidales bacterium]
MVESALSVLQLNTYDDWGGAANVALNLHRGYGRAGLDAKLAVKVKRSRDSGVLEVPLGAGRSLYYRAVNALGNRLSTAISDRQRADRFSKCFRLLSEPVRAARVYSGWADYHHPWSRNLPDCIPGRFDIVHCHNLHGGYYDLHAIADLSASYPLILTMHDAWMLNGTLPHIDDGAVYDAGKCPDLEYVPSVQRDRTFLKWKEKGEIFRRTKLYVATPSRWLMERVESSIMAPSIVESRVIPNGVDHDIFKPPSEENIKGVLGLDGYGFVILFVATHVKKSRWRDYGGMINMLRQLDMRLTDGDVAFVALGEAGADEKVGSVTIKHVPYLSSQSTVAEYYKAADVYLHLSNVDTFPTAVIEALSCGTPVVAYRVGGIREQVKSLDCSWSSDSVDRYGIDRANGILVDRGDESSVVNSILYLREMSDIRTSLSENAVRDARERFGLESQVKTYLKMYSEMLVRYGYNSRS